MTPGKPLTEIFRAERDLANTSGGIRRMTLIPTFLRLSAQLRQAIDAARGGESQGEFIERVLWSSGSIKAGAKLAGVKRPDRPKPGRPKQAD